MPFKSARQRRYLYAKHPEIARRWSAEEKAVNKSAPRYGAGSGRGSRLVETEEIAKSRAGLVKVPGHGVAERHAAMSAQNRKMLRANAIGAGVGVGVGLPFFPSGYREGQRSKLAGEPMAVKHVLRPGYGWGRTLTRKPKKKDSVEKFSTAPVKAFARSTGAELSSTFRPFSPQAKVMAAGKPNPRASMFQNRVAETVKKRPKAAGTIAGGSLVGAYGLGGVGKAEVAKRRREYDAEHRRQRRLGMYQAGAGGGGLLATGYGLHGIREDTKKLRAKKVTTQVVNDKGKTVPGPHVDIGQHVGRGTVHLRTKPTALLGGGLLALGGAGAVRHHAESSRGRVRG